MRHELGRAMASRAAGLRRVRRLTWSIAGAGAVGAVVLAFGFGSHAHQASPPARSGQAPAGSQGTVGDPQSGTPLQPPPANPLPAQGPGQVVSGGS